MPQYGAIAKVTVNDKEVWRFRGPDLQPIENENLILLLNFLSSHGWEVVTAGNFGGGSDDEVIVRR